ncbi:2023_t:CDS:2 [Acaulospora colombiana]|uniref:2023_t:CDS:1 n=1 Tax=Acaulospora colombiana TaxID=27376 RepID=A0ACA9K656_9GLOM|nr:2023_t:CDS:2 [Acaulospora colombiana]
MINVQTPAKSDHIDNLTIILDSRLPTRITLWDETTWSAMRQK